MDEPSARFSRTSTDPSPGSLRPGARSQLWGAGRSSPSHRQSRRPASARGKRVASRSALRHGVYSQFFFPFLEDLGESEADFLRSCRSLEQALQPRDGLEAQLVGDLAQLRWRQQRLVRAEAALVVHAAPADGPPN